MFLNPCAFLAENLRYILFAGDFLEIGTAIYPVLFLPKPHYSDFLPNVYNVQAKMLSIELYLLFFINFNFRHLFKALMKAVTTTNPQCFFTHIYKGEVPGSKTLC